MVGLIDTLPMRAGMRPAESHFASQHDPDQPIHPTSAVAFHVRRVLQSGGLTYAKDKLRARALRVTYTILESAKQPIPNFLRSASDIGWFAAVRYVPQPFSGKIILFNTAGSPERSRDTYDLWSGLTGGNVELHEIAGMHENVLDERQVRALANEVTDCLARS
jgi:thioesterase domain-containing protein